MTIDKNIVVLTGAGISAESGIKTFRDSGGLWEGYDIMEVASPEGWEENPKKVLDFYNARRKNVNAVQPNKAHLALVELEEKYKVNIITQNIDDLHERAGSTNILHLHGEIFKSRSTIDEQLIYDSLDDVCLGDVCEKNSQLRPHIVWFGEMVPALEEAIELVSQADILIIIGTSMQVYPAAGLVNYASSDIPIYYIDPKAEEVKLSNRVAVIAKNATEGVREVVDKLLR